MAKSVQERCDKLVGTGATFITAGGYKTAEDVTQYKFGIAVDIPALPDELKEKIYNIGLHRVMSVKAAGMFNKANDFGTVEDAEAYATMFSTVDGWATAFEKGRREGGAPKVDTGETLAIRKLAAILKEKVADGSINTAKVPYPQTDNPPMTGKGIINFNAWAKIGHAANHPWYEVAFKLVNKKAVCD